MNENQMHSISRVGLDAAFEADEARKSNLIIEARLLLDRQNSDEAGYKFAEAALIEESLSQRCLAQGLIEKSFLHGFSAVSLWAQAGNFFKAIALGNELLSSTELPEHLRQRVRTYTNTLSMRRIRWYEELTSEMARTAA